MRLQRFIEFSKINERLYIDIDNFSSLNENLEKSIKFLKDRYLLIKAAKDIGKLQSLNDDPKSILNYNGLIDFGGSDMSKIETRMKLYSLILKDKKDSYFFNRALIDLEEELGKKIKIDEYNKKEIDKIKDLRQNIYEKEFNNLKNNFFNYKDDNFFMNSKLNEILDLVGYDKSVYVFNLFYIYFIENVEFEKIKKLHDLLLENKDLVKRNGIPILDEKDSGNLKIKKFDLNFINQDPNYSNYKVLYDGLILIKIERENKSFLKSLTKKLIVDYENKRYSEFMGSNDNSKIIDDCYDCEDCYGCVTYSEIVNFLYKKFNSLGLNVDQMKKAWQSIFGMLIRNLETGELEWRSDIARYNEIDDFIKMVYNKINAILYGYSDRIDKIEEVGSGCEILYDNNNIIIIEVFDYESNYKLNSHTGHCIINKSQWDYYVKDTYRQLYIYNFNIPQYEEYSTIGVTIPENGKLTSGSCQTKSNKSIHTEFFSIIKKWEEDYNINEDLSKYFKPISEEEIIKRANIKRSIELLCNDSLSLKNLEYLLNTYNLDINLNNSCIIKNAISHKNNENIIFCIEKGSNFKFSFFVDKKYDISNNFEFIKRINRMNPDEFKFPIEFIYYFMDDYDKFEFIVGNLINGKYDISYDKGKVIRYLVRNWYKFGIDHSFRIFNKLNENEIEFVEPDGRCSLLMFICENAVLEILKYFEEKEIDKKISLNTWKISSIYLRVIPKNKIPMERLISVLSHIENRILAIHGDNDKVYEIIKKMWNKDLVEHSNYLKNKVL